MRRIVVDAGHGGKDMGAVSPRGVLEKDVNLDVARLVAERLRAEGFDVLMTREEDRFIPLPVRAKMANRKEADLFVSIHSNASTSRQLKGFEVYSLSEEAGSQTRAQQLALNDWQDEIEDRAGLKSILWQLREDENRRESKELAGSIGSSARRSMPIAAERLRTAGFYVLKWTECPAVLVELGYLSNRQDESKLRSPHYRRRAAEAIVKGVLEYRDKLEVSGR